MSEKVVVFLIFPHGIMSVEVAKPDIADDVVADVRVGMVLFPRREVVLKCCNCVRMSAVIVYVVNAYFSSFSSKFNSNDVVRFDFDLCPRVGQNPFVD